MKKRHMTKAIVLIETTFYKLQKEIEKITAFSRV